MGERPPRFPSSVSHLFLANTHLFAGAFQPKAYPKLSFLSLGAYRAPHVAASTVKALVKDFAPQISAFRADQYSMHLVRSWKPEWNSLGAHGVCIRHRCFADGTVHKQLNLPQKVSLRFLYFEDPKQPEISALDLWKAHATLVAELLEADPIAPSLSGIKTIRFPGRPELTEDHAGEVRDLVARLAALGEDVQISWNEEVEEGGTDQECGLWTEGDSFLRFVKSLDGQSSE